MTERTTSLRCITSGIFNCTFAQVDYPSEMHLLADTLQSTHSGGAVTGQEPADFGSALGYFNYIKVSPLRSPFSSSNSTDASDGSHSGAPLGLGLLIGMVSVALAIAIIALLISKMRRRQSTDSDIELEVPTDPYMQAIMFPSEPRPEWHRHLRQVLHKAGQKIFKKPEHHDTNIPENLRYQLKQIYVY